MSGGDIVIGREISTTPPVTVNAPSASVDYGDVPTNFTPTYTGFVTGDTASSLTTPATCTSTATDTSPLGNIPDHLLGRRRPQLRDQLQAGGNADHHPGGDRARGRVAAGDLPATIGVSAGQGQRDAHQLRHRRAGAGRTVAFTAGGRALCSEIRDPSASATRSTGALGEAAALRAGGYPATFAEDADYLGSTATTPWFELDSGRARASRAARHGQAISIRGTLSRDGSLCGTLTSQAHDRATWLSLNARHRLRAGRYTLSLRIAGAGAGSAIVWRAPERVAADGGSR